MSVLTVVDVKALGVSARKPSATLERRPVLCLPHPDDDEQVRG